MDSKPVNVNVGRFGLSRQQLIEQAYERLTISAAISGVSLSPISQDEFGVFDPSGRLIKKVKHEDLITMRNVF